MAHVFPCSKTKEIAETQQGCLAASDALRHHSAVAHVCSSVHCFLCFTYGADVRSSDGNGMMLTPWVPPKGVSKEGIGNLKMDLASVLVLQPLLNP